MATVADCVTVTNTSGQNPIQVSADFKTGPSGESPTAFSIEGTHKEPVVGQVWPRLAAN